MLVYRSGGVGGVRELKVTDLKTNSEKEEVVVMQQVPKEKATVKTINALENSYGDKHLAVRHC
jgi:hypothetical protein